jgi:hypothetical protein
MYLIEDSNHTWSVQAVSCWHRRSVQLPYIVALFEQLRLLLVDGAVCTNKWTTNDVQTALITTTLADCARTSRTYGAPNPADRNVDRKLL